MLVQANGSSVKIADFSKRATIRVMGHFCCLVFLKGYTCNAIGQCTIM